MVLAIVWLALFVVGTMGSDAESWCQSLARTPTVCSEERLKDRYPAHSSTLELPVPVPHAPVENLSFERALDRLDVSILDKQQSGVPTGGLHLLRGRLLESHGLLSEALCDMQIAASQGEHGAGDEALAVLARVEIAERESFTTLNALRRHVSPRRCAFERMMKEWRYEHVHHSTAIEGNPLSYADVRAFLETRLVSGETRPIDVYLEVLGTDDAFSFVVEASGFGDLSNTSAACNASATAPMPFEQLLLDIHRRVMLGSPLGGGAWRTVKVRVADYVAPPPSEVPRLMSQLFAHWSSPEFSQLHPAEQAALAHFEFVWVHPFEDGNGRTARLLSSYLLMRAGFPPLNLLLAQRSQYYSALKSSHPRNGGCTRALVQMMQERVQLLSDELSWTVPSHGAASNTPSAVEIDADGSVNSL